MTRRLAAILVPIGLMVLTGCTSTSPPDVRGSASASEALPASQPLATYQSTPMTFQYPDDWSPAHFDVVSSFSSSIVYLSNQPTKDPCVRRSSSITCERWALDALKAGGVILEWTSNGFPGWSFARQPGRVVKVDGRNAKVSTRRDVCGGIGADRWISVIVSRHPADNWYELDGCFKDPGAKTALAQVLTMLPSVRIDGS